MVSRPATEVLRHHIAAATGTNWTGRKRSASGLGMSERKSGSVIEQESTKQRPGIRTGIVRPRIEQSTKTAIVSTSGYQCKTAADPRGIGGYADYDRARESETPADRWASAPKPVPMDPMDSPTILPFRKYAQTLRELGTEPCALATGPEATQELYDKYQEYRLAHTRKMMLQFWEAHKADKWFVEKYGIGELEVQRRNSRRKMGREGKKAAWLEELREGKLDKVCWDAREDVAGTLIATSRLGQEELLEGSETVNVGPEPNRVLVRQVPADVAREEVEEALHDEPGFRYLALGEPHPNKRWARVGWVHFDESQDMQDVVERLNQKTIAGQKLAFEVATRAAQAKLKIAPEYACSLTRLAQDLDQAKELVELLSAEDTGILWKGEEDAVLSVDVSHEIEERCETIGMPLSAAKEEEGESRRLALKKALDLHIDLLREVYNCDYYSSILCDFPEELSRRSPKHLRRTSTREDPVAGEKSWASNLDSRHKLLMRPNDNEIGELGGTALDKVQLELAAPYSQEDGEQKHRCTVTINGKECSKPFMAQIFVQKHVLKKHPDFFEEISKDKVESTRYFNSYVRDPQRVMPPLAAMNGARETNGHGAGGPHTHSQAHAHPPPAALSSRIGSFETGGGGGGDGGYYGSSGLIRMGGLSSAVDRHARRGGAMDDPPSLLGMRMGLGPVQALHVEPLPSNPRPLDPRAALAPKRYEDLDAGGGPESGEIDLEY